MRGCGLRIVVAFGVAGIVGWCAGSLLLASPRTWPYIAALMVLCLGLPLLLSGWSRAGMEEPLPQREPIRGKALLDRL